jgi:Uma2 family endonuclease
MATRTKLTYDDYAALPDDGKRYEVLAGELYVVPAPTPFHQRESKRLQRQLEAFFEEKGLGEVFNAPLDVILGPHDVAQPDILVVLDPLQLSQRGVERAPDLVVEVLSPSNRNYDRIKKAGRYLATGVEHYWILDPEARHLQCLRAQDGAWIIVAEGKDDDRVTDPSWPDLAIEIAALWKPPPTITS